MRAEQNTIPLACADGTSIPNVQGAAQVDASLRPLIREYFSWRIRLATQLRGPSDRYNCHGLVFASRRTNVAVVSVPFDVREILRRDGYVLISGAPQPGDVAIYCDPATREVIHSGIVTHWNMRISPPLNLIWSMWPELGEFEHKPAPASTPYPNCDLEFWRLS
jgi:hypothetical protein